MRPIGLASPAKVSAKLATHRERRNFTAGHSIRGLGGEAGPAISMDVSCLYTSMSRIKCTGITMLLTSQGNQTVARHRRVLS